MATEVKRIERMKAHFRLIRRMTSSVINWRNSPQRGAPTKPQIWYSVTNQCY